MGTGTAADRKTNETAGAGGMTVIGQKANHHLGHIAIGHPGGRASATLTDECDGKLHWWPFDAGELDPAGAKELAAELIRWAQRTEAQQAMVPAPSKGA
jgi:hypothetical protein